MAEKKLAPRLHVLMASQASYGVIIRRGPSKHVCTIGWNRSDDSFKLGQWLKGRIYERRSDLSPDGKHMIYFAMNGRWQSESKGSWTALSKAPYLKAKGFWTKGDCWHGGGLFVKNGVFWLNDGYGHTTVQASPLKRIEEYPDYEYYGGECFGVYFLRLMRDGWELKSHTEVAEWHDIYVFEKRLHNKWIFRKNVHGHVGAPVGKSVYYDTHEIENAKTGEKIDGATWEWAEVDGRRIVWAESGKLFGARMSPRGMGETKMLCDATSMKFERIEAPY